MMNIKSALENTLMTINNDSGAINIFYDIYLYLGERVKDFVFLIFSS